MQAMAIMKTALWSREYLYKLQIMLVRGIQNGKINWFVLNLMDKEILRL